MASQSQGLNLDQVKPIVPIPFPLPMPVEERGCHTVLTDGMLGKSVGQVLRVHLLLYRGKEIDLVLFCL